MTDPNLDSTKDSVGASAAAESNDGNKPRQETKSITIELSDQEQAALIYGVQDRNLKKMRECLSIGINARGTSLHFEGEANLVACANSWVSELMAMSAEGNAAPVEEKLNQLIDEFHLQSKAMEGELRSFNGLPLKQIARTSGQLTYLEAMAEQEIVLGIGPAGSGKTYLAVRMAVEALKAGAVKRLILCRPAVEAGEKLGFLPGDFQAKVNPYLRPLYDALNDLLDYDQIRRYTDREIIEVAPLAYMRGRTLNNAFIILDEAQNTTRGQMKMFLTRLGMESRVVVTGDITQVDLPHGQPSGLLHAKRVLSDVPGIATVEMTAKDIVRNPIVNRIVSAYNRHEGMDSEKDGQDKRRSFRGR